MPREKKFCYEYPRPMVTVDCVLMRVRETSLELLLVRRRRAPQKGKWALPGGFIGIREPLEAAALRELSEETGAGEVSYLLQIGAYGDPKRDTRGRVISVAFLGIAPTSEATPAAGDDAAEARWFAVELLPDALAFDHATIIGDALRRLAAAGRSSGALFAFVPREFELPALGNVLHAVYGTPLDPTRYLAPFIEAGFVKALCDGKRFQVEGRERN